MARLRYSLEEVLEATEQGVTKSGTARVLGVSRQTVEMYCKRWKAVDNAFREKRRELVDLAETGLRNAVERGEPWAITFTLKTLGKEEGFTERQEVVSDVRQETVLSIEGLDAAKASEIRADILRSIKRVRELSASVDTD